MATREEEFLQKLRAAFAVEADEHLQAMSSGLLELEALPPGAPRAPLVEAVFREAHSLKGAARAVNMAEVETICQALETVFAAWKRDEITPSRALFDALSRAIDAIGKILAAPDAAPVPVAPLVQQLSRAAAGELQDAPSPAAQPNAPPPAAPRKSEAPAQRNGAMPESAPAAPSVQEAPAPQPPVQQQPPIPAPSPSPAAPEKRAPGDTVRISTAKLDALLLQAEELLAVKLTAGQRAADLHAVAATLAAWHKEWAVVSGEVRVVRRLADKERKGGAAEITLHALQVARMLEFLDWNQACFKALESTLSGLSRAAQHDRRATDGMVDSLLEDAKKLLMLPFSTLLGVFPKMVRDLARDQGKDVQLTMRGGDIEIDKRILEEIKDPLVHLLRNSVDHGIEAPAERQRRGKPKLATVTLAVSQKSGGEVELLLCDDGGGIDAAKVKVSAVRQGVLTEAEAAALDEAAALALIFQSGVSSSAIITEISGRGLGMAIVREKIEKLGGAIRLETQPGQGTTFHVSLPLTLATFRGILVEAAGQMFVIPLASVERVITVREEEIEPVSNRATIRLQRAAGPEIVSLVRLADVLELAASSAPTLSRAATVPYAVVLSAGDRAIAFGVDAVLNEHEVLVKKLGRPLVRVRNVAGATVLGSGRVVAILNADDLLKSAAGAGAARFHDDGAAAPLEKKSILVAEDSITSRMLLKNILEGAGYQVATAVDGQDALAALHAAEFDLVVSDVDMPRLNGLDLTARMRDDGRLAEVPVVLVTARETREDRERGIEVGANAYLVKSSFDQSNLLEAIRRLV